MAGPQPTVYTIGCEQLAPEALARELEIADVQRVIDVRPARASWAGVRIACPDGTAVACALAKRRIACERRVELTPPGEADRLHRAGGPAAAARRYREHLRTDLRDVVVALADELATEGVATTALLGVADDPERCHRRELADALREHRPDLRVIDL